MLPRFVHGCAARPARSWRRALYGRIPSVVDSAIQQITAAELHRHIAALASDEMAGRGVGHAGNQAEQYIAGALRDANVPPAAPDYLQAVEVYSHAWAGRRLTIDSGQMPPLADLRVGRGLLPLAGVRRSAGGRPRGLRRSRRFGAGRCGTTTMPAIDASGAVVLVLDDVPDAREEDVVALQRRAGGDGIRRAQSRGRPRPRRRRD